MFFRSRQNFIQGKKRYTIRIAQKLSSEQQNHLKEGPGGLCLILLEYCLTFFESNLELLTQIAKFDEK